MKRFLVILLALAVAIAVQPGAVHASGNLGYRYKPVVCKMPKAPVINVTPRTAEVVYDYSMNSHQLASMKSQSKNPFGKGVDTTTGGLRVDQPVESIRVSWGYETYTPQNISCLWYDRIDITVDLAPHIYIANDGYFSNPVCHNAIVDHELKHVKVDRYVMNEHAKAVGSIVARAVNEGGVVGPFPSDQVDDMEKGMANTVDKIVEALLTRRQEQMSQLQSQVDSLQEYQRVSNICNAAMGRPAQNFSQQQQ